MEMAITSLKPGPGRRRASRVRRTTLFWATLIAAGIQGEAAPGESAGRIDGIVQDDGAMRLPRQIVSIGAHRTVSDGDGRFSIVGEGISVPYDLLVASPGGDHVTLYQGLTRRDPLVTHSARHPGIFPHKAHIAGAVYGNMPKGKNQGKPRGWSWEFQFASPRTRMGNRPLAGWFDASGSGAYGPIPVGWDGSDTVKGRMMVLFRMGADSVEWGAFAEKFVTLRAGETLAVDLRPVRVPVVHRRSPKIAEPGNGNNSADPLDEGFPRGQEAMFFDEFRADCCGPVFHGDQYSGTTVDLRAFGIRYCHEAQRWDPHLHSLRSHCGFDPASPGALKLPLPVSFAKPVNGTLAAPGMAFAWSGMSRAVYCLDLSSASGDPSARHPAIRICTGRTSATWPDLAEAGVGFPKAPAAYSAKVSAMGPMGSIDDLAASGSYRDYWKTESRVLSLPLHPPMGKKAADCRYKQFVACGGTEMYQLSAMNRKLRYFPEFADAVNIHCVTDCSGARAYMRAYAGYLESHPGFDQDEPLEAEN